MLKSGIAIFMLILSLAPGACASDCESHAGVSCSNMQVNICPQGDFEYISHGCGGSSDYIWVQAIYNGEPIPGIPASDFWIGSCDPERMLCYCSQAVTADSATNADGRTTISGPISEGLCNIAMDGTSQGI